MIVNFFLALVLGIFDAILNFFEVMCIIGCIQLILISFFSIPDLADVLVYKNYRRRSRKLNRIKNDFYKIRLNSDKLNNAKEWLKSHQIKIIMISGENRIPLNKNRIAIRQLDLDCNYFYIKDGNLALLLKLEV